MRQPVHGAVLVRLLLHDDDDDGEVWQVCPNKNTQADAPASLSLSLSLRLFAVSSRSVTVHLARAKQRDAARLYGPRTSWKGVKVVPFFVWPEAKYERSSP